MEINPPVPEELLASCSENVAHDYASLFGRLVVPPVSDQNDSSDEERFVDLDDLPPNLDDLLHQDEPLGMEIDTPQVELVNNLTEVQGEIDITEDVYDTLRKYKEALEKKDKEIEELKAKNTKLENSMKHIANSAHQA